MQLLSYTMHYQHIIIYNINVVFSLVLADSKGCLRPDGWSWKSKLPTWPPPDLGVQGGPPCCLEVMKVPALHSAFSDITLGKGREGKTGDAMGVGHGEQVEV